MNFFSFLLTRLSQKPVLVKLAAKLISYHTSKASKQKHIVYTYTYIISITIMAVICKGSSYNGGDNTGDWEHSAGF